MKQPRLTRRQFLKIGAFGAGVLALPHNFPNAVSNIALAAVAAAPSHEALSAAQQPGGLSMPQPTFNAIASTTAFGPPTDLSSGWDGTLWAIDASGSPHLHDPIQDAWLQHGDGIDAAANVNGLLHFFRGNQVLQLDTANNAATLSTIAEIFPKVPDSFKLGVTGAAYVNDVLVLFNGGRYVRADGSAPPKKLTDLPNWPKTNPIWQDGLITGVFSDGGSVILLNGAQNLIYVNFALTPSYDGGGHIKDIMGWGQTLPADWVNTGFDAGFIYPVGQQGYYAIHKGTAVAQYPQGTNSPITPKYVPAGFGNWPAEWNPVLNHAPSGRMGQLWCATRDLKLVQHNGESWTVMPGGGNTASVGQDGTVMVTSQTGLYLWNGTGYDSLGSPNNGPLSQVTVGDANHVWVRDANNVVHRYDLTTKTFKPMTLGAGVPPATHMTANADGTLWHCNNANPNAFRLISEGAAASNTIPLKGAGLVAGVQKVASTGFGTAHCLARHSDNTINVYRYDSPYVFKTANNSIVWNSSLSPFAEGLGNLYFVEFISEGIGPSGPETLNVQFVAMDMHTGAIVASYTPPGNTSQYTGMVFDPVNELVYVASAPFYDRYNGSSPGNGTPGILYALDARTMAVRWTTSDFLNGADTFRGVDATPALRNGLLCFGDRAARVFCIDTSAALAAIAQKQRVPYKWIFPIDTNGPIHRVSTPLITDNQVVAMMWDLEYDPADKLALYTTVSIDIRDGSGNNFGLSYPGGTVPMGLVDEFSVLQPPLIKPLLFPGQSKPTSAMIVRAVSSIVAWNLESDEFSQLQFKLPGGTIASGVTYDDGSRLGAGLNGPDQTPSPRLWFGDNQGNLWALDQQLKAVDHTPHLIRQNTSIYTTPTLYKDPQGGLTVLYGLYDASNTLPPSIYGYDPTNGNHASIPTGVTSISMLSPTVNNGVVYAGGTGISNGQEPVQVFGIRVDGLPQALRDFIIESQLMQDPDETAASGDPANHIPPSFARYQTHLTVVDDAKNPAPYEPVKIWADTPATIVVDGTTFNIGPGDAQFASIKTGIDGGLVIAMTATDYFAPTLRVWAAFMDPYERIVINPDTEFHQRVMTAHANATDSDPDKVNLTTATNYKGQPLFTDDEKKANPPVPQNVANSIQTANQGLGLSKGTGNSKQLYRKMMRAMGVKHKNQRVQVSIIDATAAAATADKYVAYDDLPGATHFPINIPATRAAPIAQAIGLSYSRPNGDVNQAPVFAAMSHVDARAAIDALQGEAWKPTDPYHNGTGSNAPDFRPMRTFNIFQDFWNWLKGLFDKIAQCILSIAEDILAGIQYFVDGVLKVFKAILKVLEDVFPFLGSFFKMLEKLIDDVVAGLSILFNFGEIMWTHRWLAGQVNTRVTDMKTAIKSTITPAINSFFTAGENAVKAAFDKLRGNLSNGQQINHLKGMNATPHTMFTFGRRGTGNNSSHATQCNFANQKLKSGAPSASEAPPKTSTSAGIAAVGAPADAVSDFFTTFVNRLSSDSTLSAAFNQLKSDAGKLFSANSAQQFFATLLNTLLDILETLIIGALAVTNAFIDGLLAVIDDAIDAVLGVLNTEIQIPFITWLYEKLFNEPLTLLNLATLVAAIPLTIICRVVEGQYPSALFPPVSVMQAGGVAAAPEIVVRYLGIFNGMLAFGYGTVNAIGDAEGDEASPVISKISLGLGLLMEAFSFPLIGSNASEVSSDDWVAYGFGVAIALLGIGGVSYTGSDGKPTSPIDGVVQSVLTSILNIMLLTVTIIAFVDDGKTDPGTDVGFAAGLVSALPGLINPAKLAPQPAPVIVGVVDFVGGCVLGALEIAVAVLVTLAQPTPGPHRLHLPGIMADGQIRIPGKTDSVFQP